MQVLDRWRSYEDNIDFRKAFEDEELVALSRSLFPDITSKVMQVLHSQHQADL
jgi:hypothetical protein